MNISRCGWVNLKNQEYIDYHDHEWGRPTHDEKVLFEFLILESAQAGLSWETILNKRNEYKKAYKNFDPKKVSKFTSRDVDTLMQNKGIVRNRLKINASIKLAMIFLEIQREKGSFLAYLHNFAGIKPINNKHRNTSELPIETKLSREISNDLKKRGAQFFGPTTCYAYLQAVGIVNDHTIDCFCYKNTKSQ